MNNTKKITSFSARIISGNRVTIPNEEMQLLNLKEGEIVTIVLYTQEARDSYESLIKIKEVLQDD